MRQAKRLAKTEHSLVWMFGSPRSGSTWLLNMLNTRPGIATIDEPGIASHLGLFAPDHFVAPARTFSADQLRINDGRAASPDYFFADRFADVWRPALRALVLGRFAAQLDLKRPPPSWCFLKEPNGSQAADIVMSLLPESRLLVLVRDGRDVVDSQLDAAGENTWLSEWGGGRTMDASARLAFVEEWGVRWAFRGERTMDAYDNHDPELRMLLRYEDLRVDPLGNLRRILDWIGVDHGADLEQTVAAMAFEKLPAQERGEGKFHRKAQPGYWRESLTGEEQELASRVMGPALTRLGYQV